MRNPNYTYTPCPDTMRGGWMVKSGDLVVWGNTKPAARARLLRVLKLRFKDKTTEEIYQELKGNGEVK